MLRQRPPAGPARLAEEDQTLVKRLGGILRLADGLDRRRAGVVQEVGCRLAGAELLLTLQGCGDLSVELYGARTKGDLIESAFGRKLVLNVAKTGYSCLSS